MQFMNLISNLQLVVIFSLINSINCKLHTFHYSATWINANPDGLKERPIISFNGTWPLPALEFEKGDTVNLYLHNGLENKSTSLHFHGLFQNGTTWMDGAEMISQCPIPPGETFLYNFTLDQSGTYWYHSHSGSQYSDGLRGSVVVHDKEIESLYEYDHDLTVTLSDWYHDESDILVKKQLTRYNPTGAEPVPQNLLFMDKRDVSINVEKNQTYLMRFINMGIMVSQFISFEDHDFEIVEIDGVFVKPQRASMIYLAVGQRVSILLKTKNDPSKNYAIIQAMDTAMLDVQPDDLQVVSINYLSYSKDFENSKPDKSYYDIDNYEPFDDFYLTPIIETPILTDPDYQILVDVEMENLGDGINYAFFNNISYKSPKVPSLLTALSSPDDFTLNSKIYGSNTNSFILNPDEVIEIVINNKDDNKHPFHLHGHQFQTIYRSDKFEEPVTFDPNDKSQNNTARDYPSSRDTVVVNGNGYLVIRFKSDNPGVWIFHCHLDFHLEQGLALTIIESPLEIKKQLHNSLDGKLPDDYLSICRISNTPLFGNAAGNSGKDWLNLHGENKQPDPLPEGFTLKGYIALFICTIIALLGLKSIYDYGMDDVKLSDKGDLAVVVSEREFIDKLSSKLTTTKEKWSNDNNISLKNQYNKSQVESLLDELKDLNNTLTELESLR
ncbi:hypothetical protein B5S32_g2597 [[Candida] boidinii]|nr:hypothetical protein B5S32_g2597 [[Candida] boidinii]